MATKIVFATNNAHKLEEIRQIAGETLEVLSLADIGCTDDIPEDADTLEGNARQKAQWVFRRYGVRCFADDTGLEVDALDGAPGVHTARFAALAGKGESHDAAANMQHLLDSLDGVPADKRTARFRTVIAIAGPGEDAVVHGVVEGRILETPQGNGGFGYDPVFCPEGWNESFACASADAKNAVSHRGRATAALLNYLKNK